MLTDIDDDLRAARQALNQARVHAPALPSRPADAGKAIGDVLTAVEKLEQALEKIADYMIRGRGGGGNPYSG
jgi:hypothetical protein